MAGDPRARYDGGMAKDDPARAERLADALRLNLRRRKAQARALDGATDEATDGPPAPAITQSEAPSRP